MDTSGLLRLPASKQPSNVLSIAREDAASRAASRNDVGAMASKLLDFGNLSQQEEDPSFATKIFVNQMVSNIRAPLYSDTSLSTGQPVFVVNGTGEEWRSDHVDAAYSKRPKANQPTTVLSMQALNQFFGELSKPENDAIRNRLLKQRENSSADAAIGQEAPIAIEDYTSGLPLDAPSALGISEKLRYVGFAADVGQMSAQSGSTRGHKSFRSAGHISTLARGLIHNVPNIFRAASDSGKLYVLGGRWLSRAQLSGTEKRIGSFSIRLCHYDTNVVPALVPPIPDRELVDLLDTSDNNPFRDVPLGFTPSGALDNLQEPHIGAAVSFEAPPLFYRSMVALRTKDDRVIMLPTSEEAITFSEMIIIANGAPGDKYEYKEPACRAASLDSSYWRSLPGGNSVRTIYV